MSKQSPLVTMPKEVQDALNLLIIEGKHSEPEIARQFKQQGYYLASSSLNRYTNEVKRVLDNTIEVRLNLNLSPELVARRLEDLETLAFKKERRTMDDNDIKAIEQSLATEQHGEKIKAITDKAANNGQ